MLSLFLNVVLRSRFCLAFSLSSVFCVVILSHLLFCVGKLASAHIQPRREEALPIVVNFEKSRYCMAKIHVTCVTFFTLLDELFFVKEAIFEDFPRLHRLHEDLDVRYM
jgi:hypothetical protein